MTIRGIVRCAIRPEQLIVDAVMLTRLGIGYALERRRVAAA